MFDGELGRLDYNISDRHKFFYSFRHNYRVEDRNNLYHNIATGNLLNRINWGTMVDDVYTFSPTTVLNTRLNWTRFTEANDKPSAGYDFTKLGFPSYIAAASQRLVMPIVDLNQFTDWGDNAGDRTPYDIFQIFVSLTKIQGRHSLKFGRGYSRVAREFGRATAIRRDSMFSARTTPEVRWTTRPPLPSVRILPSLMLGYPTGGSFPDQRLPHPAGQVLGSFHPGRLPPALQPDLQSWTALRRRSRHHRTLQPLGHRLRSATSPARSRRRPQAAYAKNPITGGLAASQFKAKGGLLFEGQNGKYVYNTKRGYFSPRFGFAWTPGGSGKGTVIRAGFGVFVASIGTQGINQPGFSASSTVLGSATTSNLRPAVTLDNPFPTGIQQPTGVRGGTFHVPRPEHHVLQSESAEPLLHPLELRYPALARQGHGLRDRLYRQSRRAPDHRSDPELHAGAVSEHVAVRAIRR